MSVNEQQGKRQTKMWLVGLGVLATALLVVLVWLVGKSYPRSGVDYYFSFYPETWNWLSGAYNPRDNAFLHPPWGMWCFVPYVILPFDIGLALLRATSIVMLLACVWAFAETGRQRLWGSVLAIFNLHTFDLLYRGQMTAFDALGAALGWWAVKRRSPWLMGMCYLFLSLNPPNTAPFALIMLWFTWRRWERREFLCSLAIPFAVGVASFLVFGLWPLDWAVNVANRPLSALDGAEFATTLWRAADRLELPSVLPWAIAVIVLGIAIWTWNHLAKDTTWPERERLKAYLMLSTAAVFVVTPWAEGYRYVLLYAMVVPLLVEWSLVTVLLLHALTYLPLLRLVIGVENAWVDIVYAIFVFVAVVAYALRRYRADTPTPQTQGDLTGQ
jgi:hypothetical protein